MDVMLSAMQAVRGVSHRDEDLEQRAFENRRRILEDARRSVDEKMEQLKAIASLAALIGGFAMIVLVETDLSAANVAEWLLICFGALTTIVVGCMLLSMVTNSLLLVAVLNFDVAQSVRSPQTHVSFNTFWTTRCQSEWVRGFRFFLFGVPVFVLDIAVLGHVKFHSSTATAVVISAIAGVVFITWCLYYSPVGTSAMKPASIFSKEVTAAIPRQPQAHAYRPVLNKLHHQTNNDHGGDATTRDATTVRIQDSAEAAASGVKKKSTGAALKHMTQQQQ